MKWYQVRGDRRRPIIYRGPYNTRDEAMDALLRARTKFGRWILSEDEITKLKGGETSK